MEFNEIKEAYIKLKTFAKESLKNCLQENKTDAAKYLSGYLDGLYMMYREIEGSEEIFEKQIPKMPIFESEQTSPFGVDDVPYCPSCRCDLPEVSYCEKCGQALDWSDTE